MWRTGYRVTPVVPVVDLVTSKPRRHQTSWNFPSQKINKTKLKKDVQQVENDQTLSAPSSTSQSTKERNGAIRLGRKIKTSTVNRKRRNPVWPSSCVASAGASADLAVGVRGMATHKNTRRYDIINGPEIRWVW